MASLLENILIGRQYLGIEFFSVNNEEKMAFLQVHQKKDELVTARQEIFSDIESLKQNKAKLPAIIVLNNSQVLQKEIQSTDTNDKKLLNRAFPNVQADDFYYEIWRREHTSIVAICRKSYTDALLLSLQDVFRIAGVSLGVSSVSTVSNLELPSKLYTNTQQITLYNEEDTFTTANAVNATFPINGLEIPNTHLLSFCGTLKLILPTTTTGNITDVNLTLTEKYKQKAFFEKGLIFGIATLLVLLLINFFLFTYYFDNARAMDETVSINRTDIENVAKIKVRIKEKEEKLKSFSGNASLGSSVIINDIIKNIPHSMLLDEFAYHPLEKKIKEGEAIMAKDSLILISGSTLSNTAFTSWVETVSALKPIEKVTITSFGKREGGKTDFSVKIIMKR